MDDIKGSVIIPAYNEESNIERTLDSLKGQDAQVIVVVGGDDNTRQKAVQHPVTDKVLDDEKESGPGPARNQGAREASGDVVLFTDAETVVQHNWVKNHLSCYTSEDIIGVGGQCKPLSSKLKHKILFKILSDYWYRASWKVGFIQGSGWNCSYRRQEFLKENGFDEEIPFMEDTELSLRMKKHGKIIYDPSIWIKTSVRRHEGQGYTRIFLKYAKAYFNHYIINKDLEGGYFTSEEGTTEEKVYNRTNN